MRLYNSDWILGVKKQAVLYFCLASEQLLLIRRNANSTSPKLAIESGMAAQCRVYCYENNCRFHTRKAQLHVHCGEGS